MLSTVSPLLRARLTRVATPNIVSYERRYYRPTRVTRSTNDNRKPPTAPPTPPSSSSSSSPPTKQSDDDFWALNNLLSDTQQPPRKGGKKKGEEGDNVDTWQNAFRALPHLPNAPVVRSSDQDLPAEQSEEQQLSIEEAKQDEIINELKSKEYKALVHKYQKQGMWDNAQARETMDDILTGKRDDLRNRVKEGFDSPDSAIARNLKFKLEREQATISIEHYDDATLRRHQERVADIAAKNQEPLDRKEQEVVADEDPELIDTLLDRPSRVDKTIALKKGKEILEFDSQEELEEVEANKGKPSEEKMTRSKAQIIDTRKRGPAMTKNEHGADTLALLYDEEPPIDRAVIPFRDPLKKLKFLPIYPHKVRKWVTYMRHCKGRYDKWGYWENDPKLQEHENKLREQMKARARQLGDAGMLIMTEKRKRQTLPSDLVGHYRFGVQADELIGIHPKVKEMLSFMHANNSEINAFRRKQLVKRWQERPDDHGTPQVQIACMTNRVNYLTEHLKKNKKDVPCRLMLRKLLSKRQSLLKYLRKKNVPVYFQLVREMEIQDVSF